MSLIPPKHYAIKGDTDTTFYQFHPTLGFWGVPNMERMVCFPQRRDTYLTISHNEHGNRDKPFPRGNKEKTIVCIGGSHTWGGAVEQELRYPDLIEQNTKNTTVNLGHCSLGLDQACLALMQMSPMYSPSVIIIEQYPWAIHRVLNNYVNGYLRPHFYFDSEHNITLKTIPTLASNKLARKAIGSFYQYRKELFEHMAGINLKDGYSPLTDPIFLFWKTQYYNPMYDLVDKLLGILRAFCSQNNIKLMFALGATAQLFGPVSTSDLIDYELPQKKLSHLLERHEIHHVNMAPAMLAEHTQQDPVIFGDGHINVKGHAIFGTILSNELGKLGWLN